MLQYAKKILVWLLFLESYYILKRYKPTIITVTGNVGKTSTKDALFQALAGSLHVRKSEKSFNSETGVPLSIIGAPNGWRNPIIWIETLLKGLWLIIWKQSYPKVLVLEVGADKPGDISMVAKWLHSDIVVYTRFPTVPVHIEFFESKEQVIREKKSLADYARKGGTLVLNADDPLVLAMREEYPHLRAVTYGRDTTADVQIVSYEVLGRFEGEKFEVGVKAEFMIGGFAYSIMLPHILGESHVYAIAASLAGAYALGLPMDAVCASLAEYRTPPGRTSPLLGRNTTLLIDDTYNSSPTAANAALDLLKSLTTSGKKIAVIGDMLELGKHTEEEHRKLGARMKHVVQLLVTVGIRAQFIHDEAMKSGMTKTHAIHVDTAEEVIPILEKQLKKGDIVLFKASQGIRLERAVAPFLDPAINPRDVLVRQEDEWLER